MTTTIDIEPDGDDRGRYALRVDGAFAGELTFRTDGRGRRVLVHTGVEEAFEGQGLASQLAKRALDDARAEGVEIVPSCPYVQSYLERHPEYQEVVAG